MKQTRQKILRMIDELMIFCFSIGATNINVDVKETDNNFIVTLKSNYDVPTEKVKELCNLLKYPKREEMEEYYWYLAGDSTIDTELPLIAMMSDKCIVNFLEEKGIEIILYKDKPDS